MRLNSLILVALAALVVAFAGSSVARADIVVDVNQGVVQPLPIAIPAFSGSPVGAQISQVITGNLGRSGLFRPLDQSTFQERRL